MTRCETWALGEHIAEVRCFTDAGRLIQCCGHGLLCCAWQWLQLWQSRGVLTACGEQLPCHLDDGVTWVGFPALALRDCTPPDWLRSALGACDLQVMRCALAGPRDGYLLVELAADTDLRSLTPPGPDIGDATQRAIIVTCRVSALRAHAGEDIHFRYFAPQYGVREDTATGSAMRVLAPYWHSLGVALTALQCSPRGGLLHAHQKNGLAWLGGRVNTLQ